MDIAGKHLFSGGFLGLDNIGMFDRSKPLPNGGHLIPLFAVEVLDDDVVEGLPGFRKRLQWFLENRQELAQHTSYMEANGTSGHAHRLLAIPSRARLERVLRYLLDENKAWAKHGHKVLMEHLASLPALEADRERRQVVPP